MKRLWFFALTLAGALPSQADDFFGAVETKASAEPVVDESAWQRRAWLTQTLGYGYRTPAAPVSRDDANLTRVETELYGQWDWREGNWRLRLAGSLIQDWLPDMERVGLWSGYEFTESQARARDWRWQPADSYLSWQSGDWWLKGGYQTLAWGEAETLKVTDVLARRDQRWPGQEDLDNLRLPVPALRINWHNSVDLVLLPEMPTDQRPAAFDEFDPLLALRSNGEPRILTREGEDPGWALRWQSRQSGWDAQLLLADVYSFELYPTEVSMTEGGRERLTLEPWRQQVVGLGIQASQGSWLFKTEQAWHRGVQLMRQDPSAPWLERDQWRAMIMAEYAGVQDLTLTAELSGIHTPDHHPELLEKQWQTGASLRARYTLFNERLELNGQALRLPSDQGDVVRLSADWEFSDRFSASATLIDYSAHSERDRLYPYRHNDTLLVDLTWNL